MLEELIYCLCTPQTKARNALKAVERLRTLGLLDKPEKNKVALILREAGVRFHRTKAENIVEAVKIFPKIVEKIETIKEANMLRCWLVKNVKGLGMKEASHFLRNIGYNGVAIIDRHILRFMFVEGLFDGKPKTITRKQYVLLEERLKKYAEKEGLSMEELDLLIWAASTGEVLK